jgi:hypothetical protein
MAEAPWVAIRTIHGKQSSSWASKGFLRILCRWRFKKKQKKA